MNSLTIPTPAASREDPNKPKEPPPAATPLDFPCCYPQMLTTSAECDLVKLFSNILRTGPTAEHLQALNISLAKNASFDQLLPAGSTPPLSWLQDPATIESFDTKQTVPPALSSRVSAPDHEAFYTRLKELSHDNEDAFRAIKRQAPLPNHQPARVVHFRKFWDGLSLMAEYWDTSLDKCSDNDGQQDRDEMDMDQNIENEQGGGPKQKTYTGRRTDTGRNMPGKYREDTVFAFVETITWAFSCRLEQPFVQPRLKLQGMILPLPHVASVCRVPKDVREARRGISEGPVMGVFCRDQTSFRRPEEIEGEGKQEILDLLREAGLTLMLAQKRARQGKEEAVPGKGQWWAEKPRWGGGAGGETGISEEDKVDEPASADAPRKRTKKVSRGDLWRTVRPPSSTWERGVTYKQIGKTKTSEHDDVSNPVLVLSVFIDNEFLSLHRVFLMLVPDLPRLFCQPPHLHRPSPRTFKVRGLPSRNPSSKVNLERVAAAMVRTRDAAIRVVRSLCRGR